MPSTPRTVRNRIIAVTGGARGIGLATAEALAREGAFVAIGDLDDAAARSAAERIGARATGFALDVADTRAFTEFFDEVEGSIGRLDVLINNAGIMPLTPLVDEHDSVTAKQLAVNLHAVIHGTREAARRMAGTGGHIINIASFAGKFGFPGAATYCAAKHGVVGLSEAMRHELHQTGIEISVVMPAVVRTELASGLTDRGAVKPVDATDVAEAIVRTVRRPRFDVFVPGSGVATNRFLRTLPRRASEWILRRSGINDTLRSVSHDQRAAYETRVSAAGAPHEDA